MNRTRIAAASAVLALAGCGGSVPHGAPAATVPASSAAVTASPAPGTAFCARLRASGTPQVTYAGEAERQTGLASGGGSLTPEAIQAGRAIVALWITISCPQFAWLEKHG